MDDKTDKVFVSLVLNYMESLLIISTQLRKLYFPRFVCDGRKDKGRYRVALLNLRY